MRIAATTARHAVGACALAALAVSATLVARSRAAPPPPEEIVVELGRVPAARARIGELVVVGSPAYEEVAWAVERAHGLFATCGDPYARVAVYAHVAGGRVTEASAEARDPRLATCVTNIVTRLRFPVADELDVMIPIDLVE